MDKYLVVTIFEDGHLWLQTFKSRLVANDVAYKDKFACDGRESILYEFESSPFDTLKVFKSISINEQEGHIYNNPESAGVSD